MTNNSGLPNTRMSSSTAAGSATGSPSPRHWDHHRADAASLGLLILRVALGLTFVLHGWQKFTEWGLGGTTESFEGMNIPFARAAAVIVAALELAGGVALILGVLTRLFGVLLSLDMLGALVLVHAANGFFASGGGIEYVLVLGTAALALALTGPGRLAVASALRHLRARQVLA